MISGLIAGGLFLAFCSLLECDIYDPSSVPPEPNKFQRFMKRIRNRNF